MADCIELSSNRIQHLLSTTSWILYLVYLPTDQLRTIRMLASHMLVHVVPFALESLCASFDETREFLNRHLMHIVHMPLQIRAVAKLLLALVLQAAVWAIVAFCVLAVIWVSGLSLMRIMAHLTNLN